MLRILTLLTKCMDNYRCQSDSQVHYQIPEKLCFRPDSRESQIILTEKRCFQKINNMCC